MSCFYHLIGIFFILFYCVVGNGEEIENLSIGKSYDIYENVSISGRDVSLTVASTRKNSKQKYRLGFRSNGCSCQVMSLLCGCCIDMNINQFNFNGTGCMNLMYDPREFAIIFNMLWNNESIYQNSISGKNPPPVCVPIPTPPVPYIPLPEIDTCVKFFDINTADQKVHVCMDVDLRIQRAPLLRFHFDCMELGQQGVNLVKPIMYSQQNKNKQKIKIK